MKMNKWTVGLAALGLVSLSAAQAEEAKASPVLTALSATTISGYVDTSAHWTLGPGNANPPPYSFNTPSKQDGFNLNMVDIKIARAIDPAAVQWAAGYTAELNIGPDGDAITGGDNIRQAYVSLRAPIGNGLDFKVGRFDNLLGYESNDGYKNPNYTKSYGFTSEPSEHTGVLAEYRFNDWVLTDVGVANTVTTSTVNYKTPRSQNKKAILSLLTFTVPEGKLGFLAGDALYIGLDHGSGSSTTDKTHLYVGSTINTPLKDLTLGVAYDSIWENDAAGMTAPSTGYFSSIAGYVTYKVTQKLTAAGRVEVARGTSLENWSAANTYDAAAYTAKDFHKVLALTATLSYDLWANVLTRLEIRWDHSLDHPFGGTIAQDSTGPNSKKDNVLVAANVVYKF